MRTFHTGGVAGLDITQGLPRVVELFEARKPKGLAEHRREDGKVAVEETEQGIDDRRSPTPKGEEHKYSLPARAALLVKHGEQIEKGTQLNEGSLVSGRPARDPGRTEVERYLVAEVQKVYKAQGVDINDKHIELIARQMLKRVRVDTKGDTEPAAGLARGSPQAQGAEPQVKEDGGKPANGRGSDPRDHQGLAGDRVLPLGGLLPGDDEGAHRRRSRGQARPARRPEGERDHRQADPGGDRPQALPLARDRAGRAGRSVPRRTCSTRRSSPPSSGSPRTATRSPSSRASAPRSPRSSRSSRRRSSRRRPRATGSSD